MLVGVGKGAVGVMLRPGIGMLEVSSKTAHGFALACLGKEGIVGSVQRRVRQPGVSAHLLEDSMQEVSNPPTLQTLHKALQMAVDYFRMSSASWM